MPDEQFFFRTRTVFGLNPPSLAKGESRRVSTRKRTRTHLGLSPGGFEPWRIDLPPIGWGFELAFAPPPEAPSSLFRNQVGINIAIKPIIGEETALGISPRAHLCTNRDHHSNPKIGQFLVFASRQDSGPSATPLKKN